MTSGGAERQQLLLAAHFPRDRVEVEFIVLGEHTAQAAEAEALGVPVHVLGAGRRGRRGAVVSGVAASRTVASFVRLVRRRRYDIVDAWLYHAYALAALTRPLTRVPVLVAGRRSLSGFKDTFGPVDRALDALARRSADAIVANSEAVAADVVAREGLSRAKLRVIRNAVEVPAPLEPGERAAIRAGWGIGPDELVAGCVANPRHEKGLDVLVTALAVRPLAPGLRVVLVGDGPARPALEDAVATAGLADTVVFAGAMPDARAVTGAFDLAVSPSRAEGLPNSVLEAAAAGRPVVATRAGGTAEILSDGETGLLVPVEDPAALRDALDRLVADPALRARLGAAARDDVIRRFGTERLVAETEALYTGLLAARGRR